MERTFDIKRVGQLLSRQLTIPFKTIVISAGAVAAILLTIGILVAKFGDGTYTQGNYMGLVFPLFFIGGYIITSTVFAELNNPHRGYLYLMIPATAFEKLIVAWVTTALLYTVGSMVFIMIVNVLIYGISAMLGSNNVELVNLFNYDSLRVFSIYLSTQTVFLVGAIHFKRAHLVKTILALFILVQIISLYSGLNAYFILGDTLKMGLLNNSFGTSLINLDSQTTLIINSIIGLLFISTMLTVTYFKLKEREV